MLGKRVLLIDDEPDILALLTELLNDDGRCLAVRTASTLDEAVELARTERPDGVRFSDKYNIIDVAVAKADRPPNAEIATSPSVVVPVPRSCPRCGRRARTRR